MRQARNAGYQGVELFIEACDWTSGRVSDFVVNGPFHETVSRGTIHRIYICAEELGSTSLVARTLISMAIDITTLVTAEIDLARAFERVQSLLTSVGCVEQARRPPEILCEEAIPQIVTPTMKEVSFNLRFPGDKIVHLAMIHLRNLSQSSNPPSVAAVITPERGGDDSAYTCAISVAIVLASMGTQHIDLETEWLGKRGEMSIEEAEILLRRRCTA